MTKLCIIMPEKDVYSETFIRAHVERLPAEMHVLYGGGFPRYIDDGKPLVPPPPPLSTSQRLVRAVRRRLGVPVPPPIDPQTALIRYLREERFDAVLAEYGWVGVQVIDACRAAGMPLIVHFHGYDAYETKGPPFEKFDLERRYPPLFQQAAVVVAVSHDMEKQLMRLGAPAAKLRYNPYGIDPQLFCDADPGQAPPHFVGVGRFVETKAPHLTLLAFREAQRAVPAARLTIVGGGPLLEPCRQMVRALGLNDVVRLPGRATHAEVAALLKQGRAFVQHSVHAANGDAEGTPVAVLEAQGTGLPVVSTRHTGIMDVVLEGETGLLVDEFDVAGMGENMRRLATDADLAAQFGRAGRQRILAHFTMQQSIGRLAEIIDQAIKEARHS